MRDRLVDTVRAHSGIPRRRFVNRRRGMRAD